VTILDPRGTTNQNSIVVTGWARCDFPDPLLLPGLRAKTGRSSIPVSWRNLNTPVAALQRERSDVGSHAHEGEIDGRRMTLGLFWYSGEIEIDLSLEPKPLKAAEVLVAEGAHAQDRFHMTAEMRRAIWEQWHPGEQTAQHNLEHGWSVPFSEWTGEMDQPGVDEVDYYDTGIEAWMSAFLLAYTDIEPTLDDPFAHRTTPDIARRIRQIVTPDLGPPPWDVQPEPEPPPPNSEPEPKPEPEPDPPLVPPEPASLWRRLWSWLLHLLRGGGR
jgi:hypothetical protein